VPTVSNLPTSSDLRRYLEAALAVAEEADRLIVNRIERGFSARKKSDGTPVTDIDLETETLVRDRLIDRFPDHGIVGEEFDTRNPGARLQWVIDPIDGTVSLSRGIPLFGSLLALLADGRPVLGIVNLPMLGRMYHGALGLGAHRGALRLALGSDGASCRIEDEVIATGDRLQFVNAGRVAAFDALVAAHPRVRTYCDCFGHGLAAEGAVGAMVDFDLKIWDLAATEILILEAGGRFERVGVRGEGRETRYDVVFGRPAVVEWIVERIGRL
jgi:histidinol-phosphatase